jgi:hypothetical protein
MNMKNNFQPKSLALIFIILLLLAIIIWGNSILEPTMSIPGKFVNYEDNQVVYQAPSPTPLSMEMETNRSQTRGVLVGGIILVIIIVAGTLNGIKRR